MRIQFGGLCQAVLLGLALLAGQSAAAAENDGQADLERAIDIQLTAYTQAELDKVIDLCQSALDKGLEQGDEAFCRQLLVSSLLQRAETIAGLLSDEPNRRQRMTAACQAALKDVERAIEIDPKQPAAKLILAKLQIVPGGDREKARRALDEAIRLAADDDEVMVEAVRLRAGMHDQLEDGLKDLSKAIELAPKNGELRRMRGEIYLRRNKADQALADFDAAIKLDEHDMASHAARGMALLALKRYKEARDSFDRVAKRMPGELAPLFYLAQASALAGDHQLAIEDANRVLAIAPDQPFGLLLRARSLVELGNVQEALPDANRALALQPDSTYAISLWAIVTQKAGRAKSAIKDLRRQVEAKPDNVVAWLQLGLLYSAQRLMGKAVDAYSAAIELGQHRSFAYQVRGDIYLNIGMRKEAIADYEQSLNFERDNSGVLNNLAWALATSPEHELRDGAKALELALKACELTNYQEAHILSTLAAAHAENGDFQAARTWSQKSVEAADEPLKVQLRKELASYEKGEPWRDSQNLSENEETTE